MLTETLSIKVSKAEKNLLRKTARARAATPSRLLRDALRVVLAGSAAEPATLLGKHGHLFDRLDRGPGDLSTNPAHLQNFGK